MKGKVKKNVSKAKRGRPKTSASGRILSEREEEVLTGLKEGKTYKEIGDKYGISTETVRKHVSNTYTKLKVHNSAQATNKYFGKS